MAHQDKLVSVCQAVDAGSLPVARLSFPISYFVIAMTAAIFSGWSNIAGWNLHPLENATLARCTPILALHYEVDNAEGGQQHG
ncbi:MAG: hypothetical protein QNL87_02885 [Gammaproteobacteria bacterium]|nr:hypothetical protein [Gammaproteobacteria bacterium]